MTQSKRLAYELLVRSPDQPVFLSRAAHPNQLGSPSGTRCRADITGTRIAKPNYCFMTDITIQYELRIHLAQPQEESKA